MNLTTGLKTKALGLVIGLLLASITVAGSLQGGQGQGGQGQGGRGQGGPGQGGPSGPRMGRPGPGMGMRGPQSLAALAVRPDVAREIGLTEQQGAAIREALESSRPPQPPQGGGQRPDRDAAREQREAAMRALDAKLAQILSPAQLNRVEEISIQLRGLTAALDPKVQAKLDLSDAQREALRRLAQPPLGRPGGAGGGPEGPPPPPPPREGGAGPARGQGGQGGQRGPGGPDPRRAELEAQIAEILTDAQEARLRELGGKTFVPAQRRPGGQGGGQGGGRRGGPGAPGASNAV